MCSYVEGSPHVAWPGYAYAQFVPQAKKGERKRKSVEEGKDVVYLIRVVHRTKQKRNIADAVPRKLDFPGTPRVRRNSIRAGGFVERATGRMVFTVMGGRAWLSS